MEIGTCTINRPESLNVLRKKLCRLAEDLKFSELHASRLAGLVSGFIRKQVESGDVITVSLFFDMLTTFPCLGISFSGKHLDHSRWMLNDYFDEIQHDKNREIHEITARLNFPPNSRMPDMEKIEQAVFNFNQPLEEELFDLIQNKNRELEHQAEELTAAKMSADLANHAKSEFLANMSHEIRTPMNAVLGFAEVLNEMENDEKKSHYIQLIQTSGRSLLSIINDILDLSKIESGKLQMQYAPVSVPSVLNEINAIFHQKFAEKELAFEVNINDACPAGLIMDEVRLQQVLINLVGNAVKFTHSGFVRVAFSHRFSDNAHRNTVDIILSVEDSGIGIPPDQAESIFKAFEQVKGQKDKEYGGTGLGLAISWKIVELMGGEIRVDSQVGVGTKFTITVPDVEVAKLESEFSRDEKQENFEIVFDPATILIADDIDYNREVLSAYLSGQKFTLIMAENGKEAVEAVSNNTIDMILLDMKMPVMDGIQASEILKNSQDTCDIPIIAVTASVLKEEEVIIKKRCDGYLRKPVSKTTLIEELMKFLPHENVESCDRIVNKVLSDQNDEELVIPSQDKIQELYHLAMRGIMDEISEFAATLRTGDPGYSVFAGRLETMARNFDDEQIMEFAEKYME